MSTTLYGISHCFNLELGISRPLRIYAEREVFESSMFYFSAQVQKLKIKNLGTFWGKGKVIRLLLIRKK